MSFDIDSLISDLAQKKGLSLSGSTPLQKSAHFDKYQAWIEQGSHAEMKYLESHLEAKKNPLKHWAPYQSVICFAANYLEPVDANNPFPSLKVAKYAKQSDYHFWLKEKLQEIANELLTLFPNEQFKVVTDSIPLQERELALNAGLGWIGKNTCLIHPKEGSFFLLAEILTTLKFDKENQPLPDFCGKCQKCIEACPTQALTPQKLDANLCLSYWSIEAKKELPIELRSKTESWFFGCDICQDVCPWNQKKLKKKTDTPTASREDKIQELRFILTSSGKTLLKKVHGTPLYRAGHWGLKRNALLNAVELNAVELVNEIEQLIKEPRVSELAEWAKNELKVSPQLSGSFDDRKKEKPS